MTTTRMSILWVSALLFVVGPAQGSDLAELYKSVQSSVVVIETTQKAFDPAVPGEPVDVDGLGSGVLISDDGKIVTAAHVVQAADWIQVLFMDGEKIPARVLSSVPAADLALIQLERLPAIAEISELGDSDDVQVGDQVFVVGAPFGISHTLTVGHISARRVTEELFGGILPTEQFQTDTAINEGNSGGPMFNMRGEVVGIVSYIISHSGGSEGLGFVVTSNMARRLLIEQKSLWSGFQGRWLDGELARVLNLPGGSGVLVEVVAKRSMAQYLGLKGGTTTARIGEEELILGGDVILEAQGMTVAREELLAIREELMGIQDGQAVILRVLRNGEIVELKKNYYPELFVPAAPEAENRSGPD